MSNGSPLPQTIIPAGTMPILPLSTIDDYLGTSSKGHSATESHVSVDFSTYQIDTNDSKLDDSQLGDSYAQQQRHLQSWRPQEGFGHRPDDSVRSTDFAIVPSRPPLKPTVSFGQTSAYSYYSNATNELESKSQAVAVAEETQRGSNARLYCCVAVLCSLNFLCAINTTSLAAALPTLAYNLDISAVTSFWMVNAYLLPSAIIQPLWMRVSAVVGNRSMLSLGLVLLAAGSISSAGNNALLVHFIGRVLAGLGGGAIVVMVPLVLRQLQPNKHARSERFASFSYWLGTFAGAIIGGALAKPSTWRYIFYLNLPVCLVALGVIPFLLQLPASGGSRWKTLLHVDYIGWLLMSGSAVSFTLAIIWAGASYNWTSLEILIPLIASVVCFVCWILRSNFAGDSILPVSIFRKANGIVVCIGTLIHGMVFLGLVYFTPLLHSVIDHLSPTVSALTLSPYTLVVAVLSLVGGIAITTFHRCFTWASWAIVCTGAALLLLVNESTKWTVSIPVSLAVGMGLGVLAGSLKSTMQSTATNDDETIHAAPLSVFFHTLGTALGLAVSSCVFLNRLDGAMHSSPFLPGEADMYTTDAIRMAYVIQNLGPDQVGLKVNLANAYIDALHYVWILYSALAGLAFLSSTYTLVAKRTITFDVHNDQENQHEVSYSY